MTFQARLVMSRASLALTDAGAVRWTAPELRGYLNDAVREIVALKPNSLPVTVNIAMVLGTVQTLPANATQLLRVIKNVVSKKPVTVLADRDVMDRSIAGWQNPATLPFAVDVVHVISDAANPRTFYVVPGNNASGSLECVVSQLPASVIVQETNVNTDIQTYTDAVDLDPIYINACLDYVIYAAMAKDAALAGAAARAQAHYQKFMAGVTAILAGESAMSINAGASPAPSGG